MYKFISRILYWLLVKKCKSLEVHGKKNVPQLHRYVVTCNHESYNEVIMLGMALYPNQIHYIAKKELFNNKFFGSFLKSLNAFPVDRENPGPSTIKTPVNLLKKNKTIGMFPTGHRTTEETPLKRGAATIAMLAKVPIVPAAYVGPDKIMGLITGKAHIKFGEPIDTANLPEHLKKRNEKVDYITQEVTKRTRELQKELNELL